MARHYRSTREAFPCERFPALFGPYRRSRFESMAGVLFAVTLGICVAAALVHAICGGWSA